MGRVRVSWNWCVLVAVIAGHSLLGLRVQAQQTVSSSTPQRAPQHLILALVEAGRLGEAKAEAARFAGTAKGGHLAQEIKVRVESVWSLAEQVKGAQSFYAAALEEANRMRRNAAIIKRGNPLDVGPYNRTYNYGSRWSYYYGPSMGSRRIIDRGVASTTPRPLPDARASEAAAQTETMAKSIEEEALSELQEARRRHTAAVSALRSLVNGPEPREEIAPQWDEIEFIRKYKTQIAVGMGVLGFAWLLSKMRSAY